VTSIDIGLYFNNVVLFWTRGSYMSDGHGEQFDAFCERRHAGELWTQMRYRIFQVRMRSKSLFDRIGFALFESIYWAIMQILNVLWPRLGPNPLSLHQVRYTATPISFCSCFPLSIRVVCLRYLSSNHPHKCFECSPCGILRS